MMSQIIDSLVFVLLIQKGLGFLNDFSLFASSIAAFSKKIINIKILADESWARIGREGGRVKHCSLLQMLRFQLLDD